MHAVSSGSGSNGVWQAAIQAMKPSIARASCTKAESAGLRPDSRAVARSNSFSRAPPPGSTGKLTYAPELLPPNLLLKPRGRRSKGRETRSLLILLDPNEAGYRIADLVELRREAAEPRGCGAQKRKGGGDLCIGEGTESDVTAGIGGGLVEGHLAASVQFDAQVGEALDGSRAVIIHQAT